FTTFCMVMLSSASSILLAISIQSPPVFCQTSTSNTGKTTPQTHMFKLSLVQSFKAQQSASFPRNRALEVYHHSKLLKLRQHQPGRMAGPPGDSVLPSGRCTPLDNVSQEGRFR